MIINNPREAWRRQKNSALKRGIGWHFPFEEWCLWWEAQLGPAWFEKRGPRSDQYCMARKGDRGPYAPHNVRCTTVAENHKEYNGHRHNKAPTKQHKKFIEAKIVKEVFLAEGRHVDIAKRFGVDPHRVHCIKTRKYYRNITDQLN